MKILSNKRLVEESCLYLVIIGRDSKCLVLERAPDERVFAPFDRVDHLTMIGLDGVLSVTGDSYNIRFHDTIALNIFTGLVFGQ